MALFVIVLENQIMKSREWNWTRVVFKIKSSLDDTIYNQYKIEFKNSPFALERIIRNINRFHRRIRNEVSEIKNKNKK